MTFATLDRSQSIIFWLQGSLVRWPWIIPWLIHSLLHLCAWIITWLHACRMITCCMRVPEWLPDCMHVEWLPVACVPAALYWEERWKTSRYGTHQKCIHILQRGFEPPQHLTAAQLLQSECHVASVYRICCWSIYSVAPRLNSTVFAFIFQNCLCLYISELNCLCLYNSELNCLYLYVCRSSSVCPCSVAVCVLVCVCMCLSMSVCGHVAAILTPLFNRISRSTRDSILEHH